MLIIDRVEIPLPDVDPVAFRHVLECIYTDRVFNMTTSLLAPLSAFAKKFEVINQRIQFY
jgi:hypothetical protein